MENEKLNSTQKECIEMLARYVYGTGVNRDINIYKEEVLTAIGTAAAHWKRIVLEDIPIEDKNDVNFRTKVMEKVSGAVASRYGDIRRNEEALKKAIIYCPEGIKDWYNSGFYDYEVKKIVLSPGVLERIALEAPEAIEKLPEDTLSREGILRIVRLNPERWLNTSVVQNRLNEDPDLLEELKPEVEKKTKSDLIAEVERLKGELDAKDEIIAKQKSELENLRGEEEKTQE